MILSPAPELTLLRTKHIRFRNLIIQEGSKYFFEGVHAKQAEILVRFKFVAQEGVPRYSNGRHSGDIACRRIPLNDTFFLIEGLLFNATLGLRVRMSSDRSEKTEILLKGHFTPFIGTLNYYFLLCWHLYYITEYAG